MKTQIDYTNWNGKHGTRNIVPVRIFWGKTEFHPKNQWLLEAYDLDKNAGRIFAMDEIHKWSTSE